MKITSINCPACYAPLQVPQGADRMTCDYCGTMSVVEHHQGNTELKLAQQVSRSIQDAQSGTAAVMRENTEETLAELKRIRLQQEMTGLKLQLSSVQSEIRQLEREKQTPKNRRHLEELREDRQSLTERIEALKIELGMASPEPEPVPEKQRFGGLPAWALLIILVFISCGLCMVFSLLFA